MKMTPYKILIFLLMPVFLVASVVGALGYTWCFGDDGHVDIKYATVDSCCDKGSGSRDAARYEGTTIHQPVDDHCVSCLDFSTQQDEAAFLKRIKKVLSFSAKINAPSSFSMVSTQDAKMVAGHLMSQPQPRTSQTILAHRTVVLLN
jgi:hypothetical protein